MTNEQKAKTLVDGLGIIYTDCNRVTINKLLMKMADWKDEQFEKEKQQWIEKAVIFLNERVCTEMSIPEIHNMIVDFKQAMKGE